MMDYITKEGAANVSDAAGVDQWLIDAPVAGKIRVDACFISLTEATGTMAPDGVISLKVGGNEVGTATFLDDASIGDIVVFVPDGTYCTTADPTVTFADGDDILVEIKTQAVGDTTGDGDVHLCVEFGF